MKKKEEEQVLCWEGEPVLRFIPPEVRLPEGMAGLGRVERYYRRVAEQWRRRWEGEVYQRACAAAREARAGSRPFTPWQAGLTQTTACQSDACLSLYLDAWEDGGARRRAVVRQGDTWTLPKGFPLPLRAFFPGRRWRGRVLEQIARQIEARLSTGESCFYADWARRLPRCFDPERFYCTQEGPVVFFPLYTIAPYAEGIPIFPLEGESSGDFL